MMNSRAHQPEARPDLVAELGLDLVEVHRQLLVTGDVALGEIGDDFFMGRAEAVLAAEPVVHLQHQVAHGLPAAAFAPKLRGLDRRHEHFQGAGRIHLLADDVLHLAQYAHAQGRPRVEAGGEPADHAGAQHQLMRDDLGVGRCLLGGGEREAG